MSTAGEVTVGSSTGRWNLAASILGSGMAGLDATVVNVALPTIGVDLDVDFAALQWTITADTLTLASFILVGGTLGDRSATGRIALVTRRRGRVAARGHGVEWVAGSVG